jgi:hypothetical protein
MKRIPEHYSGQARCWIRIREIAGLARLPALSRCLPGNESARAVNGLRHKSRRGALAGAARVVNTHGIEYGEALCGQEDSNL